MSIQQDIIHALKLSAEVADISTNEFFNYNIPLPKELREFDVDAIKNLATKVEHLNCTTCHHYYGLCNNESSPMYDLIIYNEDDFCWYWESKEE